MTSDDLSSLRIDRGRPSPNASGGKRGFKTLAVLFIIGCGVALTVVLTRPQDTGTRPPTPPVEPTAHQGSSVRPEMSVMTASGYIVSKHKAVLNAKMTGRITKITVKEGDSVREGEILVELDDSELIAQLTVERANLNKAQLDFDRGKKMLEAGVFSQTDFDHLKASLDLARGRMQVLENQLGETRIKAPFSGTILQKQKEVGEMATSYNNSGSSDSTGILTMADLKNMEAEVDVEEKYKGQIKEGHLAEVVAIESYPDVKFEGRVDRVGAFDRAKRTFRVMVTVLNPKDILRPDMNARVTFLKESETAGPPR